MKKLFALVAIAGLAFSTLGCAESKPPAPTTPAPETTPAPDTAAPATTDAPPPEKK